MRYARNLFPYIAWQSRGRTFSTRTTRRCGKILVAGVVVVVVTLAFGVVVGALISCRRRRAALTVVGARHSSYLTALVAGAR